MSTKGQKTIKNVEKFPKNHQKSPETIKKVEKQSKLSKNRQKC